MRLNTGSRTGWNREKGLVTCKLYNFASILGLSFSNRALGGIMPFSNMRMALTIAARPLPPSRWPMFALTEPLKVWRFQCGPWTKLLSLTYT